MPGGDFGDGLNMLKRVRNKYPAICIVVFTGLDSLGIVATLEFNGINSIVNKTDDINELLSRLIVRCVARAIVSGVSAT